MIKDEFTGLKVSRQRKWQLRCRRDGRCTLCGKPVVTAWYCLRHALSAREYQRSINASVKRNRSLTYRLEKQTNQRKETK